MVIESIWVDSPLRNFNYIVACPETGEALVLDPFDHEKCLSFAAQRGFDVRQIVNTHEHFDHIRGNDAVRDATGAKLLAPESAKGKIPKVDVGLQPGDVVRVGKTIELECIDTPGHTFSHMCLFVHADRPALFSGDTLFNAGVGHCRSGDAKLLHKSVEQRLSPLPDETELYPGHDYIATNLRFTLEREPENNDARALLERVDGQDPNTPFRSTLAIERATNTFLRLNAPTVIAGLRNTFPELPENPDSETVFVKLRELRDHW